jgi:hypothetical protein
MDNFGEVSGVKNGTCRIINERLLFFLPCESPRHFSSSF